MNVTFDVSTIVVADLLKQRRGNYARLMQVNQSLESLLTRRVVGLPSLIRGCSRMDPNSSTADFKKLSHYLDILQVTLDDKDEKLKRLCSRVDHAKSTLEQQERTLNTIVCHLLKCVPDMPILKCSKDGPEVNFHNTEVKVFLRIGHQAEKVHCLLLYPESTLVIREHQLSQCSSCFRGFAIRLRLARLDKLVLWPVSNGAAWLEDNFHIFTMCENAEE